MALDVHLFRAGNLRLAFAPVPDSLLRVDEVGWDFLEMSRAGLTPDAVGRELGARHGSQAAERCRGEFSSLAETSGLAASDPLITDAGAGDWLPSSPEAPVVKSLCLNVAHDCDLACRYCFAGQGSFGGGRSLMRAEVARAAVDLLLARSGATPSVEIDFFGGEPLLNLEVVRETVDYARRRASAVGKTVAFTLTTNAASLGPDEAAYLNATMDNVVLSLDGRPEVHDRMRPFPGGRASHAAVLENIGRFVALRGDVSRRKTPDYWVRGTYTAHNLDFAEDVRSLARQGFLNISLEPVVGGPVGPGRYGLSLEHVPAIASEYLRLADLLRAEAEGGGPVTFFHFIAEGDTGPCYAKRVRGCGAGREYAAVTPEGDLYPCHQFVGRDAFRMGNVLGDVVWGAQQGEPGSDALEVARQWLGSKPACLDCWARYRCSGGCHANAHSATGDVRQPDALGCALLKSRLEASLYLQACSKA